MALFWGVFAVATALGLLLLQPGGGQVRRRVRARLVAMHQSAETAPVSLIREKYLRHLSPLERVLEELPGMQRLTELCEQAGRDHPGYRLALTAAAWAAGAGVLAWLVFGRLDLALLAAAGAGAAPVLRLLAQRRERIERFEQQLPDALELMGRALRAGVPLTDSFRFVADEMPAPLSDEFRTTWSHLNFGVPMKPSFADLQKRLPSVSLRAMTTAVLVQRETGGNLTEILDRIAALLRRRFRFDRRLRTLTAEGRMSAWVLILLPFVLSGVLSLTSPGYLPVLVHDPLGRPLIVGALVLMTIGVVWIRRTIRVRM